MSVNSNKIEFSTQGKPILKLIGTPPPKWATNFLAVIMIISFTLPALALVLVLTTGSGPKLGLFIIMLIFGAIGYYLLRALHWNYSGYETLTFEKDKIVYQAASSKFQMEKREVSKNVSFSVELHPDPIKINGSRVEAANLMIQDKDESFELKVKVPSKELNGIIQTLNELVL